MRAASLSRSSRGTSSSSRAGRFVTHEPETNAGPPRADGGKILLIYSQRKGFLRGTGVRKPADSVDRNAAAPGESLVAGAVRLVLAVGGLGVVHARVGDGDEG